MKFGPVPVAQAAGATLAHSMEAVMRPYSAQMSYRVAKGTVLTADHLEDLAQEGHSVLVVARLESGDVEENIAATRLADAIVPDGVALGVRVSAAGAGRVNLYALHAGIVVLDAVAVQALNAIHPMITIATVPVFHRVDADGMIATIKIISYAVPEIELSRAEKAAVGAMRIAGAQYSSATLIETQVGRGGAICKGAQRIGWTVAPLWHDVVRTRGGRPCRGCNPTSAQRRHGRIRVSFDRVCHLGCERCGACRPARSRG